jgi:hypothetical protein
LGDLDEFWKDGELKEMAFPLFMIAGGIKLRR